MNISANFPLVSNGFRREAYQIKFYMDRRFKNITSTIQSYPVSACVSCLALAWFIYSITLPIFTFPTMMILDYLNHTYFYKKRAPWSTSLFGLFSELKYQQNHLFLSDEDREELLNSEDRDEVELLAMLEESDRKMLEQQEAYEKDDRPVLLFLKAKFDHNEALNLYRKDEAITINGDNNKGVRELRNKYKIMLIDDITHLDDIKDGLEKITNTIQHVWILAHGSPTSMRLDDHNEIKSSDIDDLADLMQEKLAEDAHVVLYSCSTGKRIFFWENIATKFSKILPGRTIWAPKVPTGRATWDLGENFSIKVNFWDSKSRLDFLIERIANIFCLRPFKKIELDWNVTAQLQDGLEVFE